MPSQYIVLPRNLSFSKVFSIKPEPVTTLWYFLSSIADPRRPQGIRHPMPVILLLAILCLCSGYTSYRAMSEWADNYQHLLSKQLPFLAGHVPDAATFHRVFARLDAVAFEEVLAAWLETIIPQEKHEGIAIDGKTIGGAGIHLVAAFTHKLQSVLFEMGTDTKGKELVIGPAVLEHIAVRDQVVTGDALFAQKKICDQIVKRGGGYLFTVKGNQEKLEQDIRLFFFDMPFGAVIETHTQIDRWKGRVEKRTVRVSSDADLLSYLAWPGLTHVWQCRRQITKDGQTTVETAVGIAALFASDQSAKRLNQYIRGHWSIENGLHRTRDVTFGEDKATIRKNHAPQIMAALKNLVISIFHRATVRSFPVAFRRFAACPLELFNFLGLNQVTC